MARTGHFPRDDEGRGVSYDGRVGGGDRDLIPFLADEYAGGGGIIDEGLREKRDGAREMTSSNRLKNASILLSTASFTALAMSAILGEALTTGLARTRVR